MASDDLGGLPYQQASVVRQLLAERDNAKALGMTDRVAAADKQLEGLGYKAPAPVKVARDEPPQDRRATHERTDKAEAEDTPKGVRHTPGRSRG